MAAPGHGQQHRCLLMTSILQTEEYLLLLYIRRPQHLSVSLVEFMTPRQSLLVTAIEVHVTWASCGRLEAVEQDLVCFEVVHAAVYYLTDWTVHREREPNPLSARINTQRLTTK